MVKALKGFPSVSVVAKTLIASFVTAGLLATTGCTQSLKQPTAGGSLDGQAVYTRYCAACHGSQGDGQGRAAYLLFPKPRNFQRGQFKLRSTAQGRPPTDQDLVRTVREGIPGTSMFSFDELLNDTELEAVVQYVKSLSPVFNDAHATTAEQLIEIPPPPPETRALVAAGRQSYQDLRCGQCHGPEGHGDGPAAPTLRDSEGDPFPAADFTRGIYKSGGKPENLYRTFLTGMAGTPMPSFAGALQSEEQAWGLVYYILSLTPEGETPPSRSDPGPVIAARADEVTALEDPWSAAWETVPPHRVVLRPLWHRLDYPPFATLRAARTGDRIAILVEWKDGGPDSGVLRTESFADGVALQFSLSQRPPFIGMGQAGAGGQVEVWYWRADRQAAADAGKPPELASVYPNMEATPSISPPGEEPEKRSASSAAGALPGGLPHYMTGVDAGNPLSNPDLEERPVHTLAAAGFGTLTSRPPDEMRAEGNGSWHDGLYRVVFWASVQPEQPALEADFTAGRVPMALAIWNGAAGDRNGTKLVSQWLMLEPPSAEQALTAEAQSASGEGQ
ncbi:MAG: c-type cytochrome [Acidobacteriota bacterium]